jgi:hypothetical protein
VTTEPVPPPPPPAKTSPQPKPKKSKPPTRTVSTPTPRTATTAPTSTPALSATTGAKPKRRQTPVAAGAPVEGGSFPLWAIAGFALAALLLGGGVTGLLMTRGRRRD